MTDPARLRRALEEMRATAECALGDAQAELQAARLARHPSQARRAAEDEDAARAQLEALDVLEAALDAPVGGGDQIPAVTTPPPTPAPGCPVAAVRAGERAIEDGDHTE